MVFGYQFMFAIRFDISKQFLEDLFITFAFLLSHISEW